MEYRCSIKRVPVQLHENVLFARDLPKRPAVQEIMHFLAVKKIQRKAEFDLADFIQLRHLFGFKRPLQTIQVVLELRKLPGTENRNDAVL